MSGRLNRDDEPCPLCGEPYDAVWYDDATVSPEWDITPYERFEMHYATDDADDGTYLHWYP